LAMVSMMFIKVAFCPGNGVEYLARARAIVKRRAHRERTGGVPRRYGAAWRDDLRVVRVSTRLGRNP
jgi:hypothetical protein